MKGTIEREVTDELTVVIDYNIWSEVETLDYDCPPDAGGFEIEAVTLLTPKGSYDITDCPEHFIDSLNLDSIEQEVRDNF